MMQINVLTCSDTFPGFGYAGHRRILKTKPPVEGTKTRKKRKKVERKKRKRGKTRTVSDILHHFTSLFLRNEYALKHLQNSSFRRWFHSCCLKESCNQDGVSLLEDASRLLVRLYVIEFLLNSRGNSWEDSEEDEDDFGDEEDDDWKPPAAYMKKGQRGSVSAEAYGAFNQKQADSCLRRVIVLHTNLCVCFVLSHMACIYACIHLAESSTHVFSFIFIY